MESFYSKLDETFNKYQEIFIVSHKNPDLDAYGSSVGLYKILKENNKDAYVFLDINDNLHSSVKDSIELINDVNYVNKDNYKEYESENSLWVILDTHCEDRLYFKDFLYNSKNIMIIDHHIKSKDIIKNYKYLYLNEKSSSIAEIVTFYAQYKNIVFNQTIATILLAAIEIDTNEYLFKTTYKTFEASSILMKYGADNILKQEILKETKEMYLKRADYIKKSFMLNNMTAVCVLDNNIVKNEDLSAIAEEMLKFENISITFAIGKLDKNIVGISARSIGEYDMCKVMKSFGGGGHYNNAAAQIPNGKIKDILNKLNKMLEEYL